MPKIKTKKEFSIYIQDFIDYCKLKELSIKTIKSYYQTLTLFSKYLEEEKNISRVDEVDKNIVEEYLEFTKERGKYSYVANSKSLEINFQQNRRDLGKEVSPVTINCYLRNIKVFFNWLEENQVINKNTVSKVKFLKVKRKAKDQITDDEWKALIKAMDLTKFHEYRDYIITNLILDTGMRVTDVLI
jgi:integrase/recombinase XerD